MEFKLINIMKPHCKIVLVVIFAVIIYSCGTITKLSGKKFVYKSEQRKLELKFVNDSICTLTNIFDCPDIEQEYKIIVQECTYTKEGNKIYLKNKELKYGDSLYIQIPSQNSNVCDFLNENGKAKQNYNRAEYLLYYKENVIIPNITINTLYITNNKILFVKNYDRGSFGFVFKR